MALSFLPDHCFFRVTRLVSCPCSVSPNRRYWRHDTHTIPHRRRQMFFETVRRLRWPDDVQGPTCNSSKITKQGCDETQPERQRYLCKSCKQRFEIGRAHV